MTLLDLIKSNPRLNSLGVFYSQFYKIENDEAIFLALIGKSYSGVLHLNELHFKDTGDQLRLASIKLIKDLPFTYISGVTEIDRLTS